MLKNPSSSRVLVRLMLPVVSILVFGVAAEGLVRVIGPDLSTPSKRYQFRFDQDNAAAQPHHVRDPELGWRLAPGQTDPMVTNAHGFRGRNFTVAKPPNTYRVVCIGDSNPMGFGVRDESAPYPARLERLLNEFLSGPTTFEVVNLGVDGYSSEQVRRMFDAFGADLGADAVVVQAGFNDYCFAEVPDHEARFDPPGWRRVAERSHAYRWFRRALLSAAGRTATLSTPGPRVSPPRYADNLAAIISRARDTGATVYVLTTPARPTVPLVINEVLVDDDRYITQSTWLSRWLRDAGVDADAPLGDSDTISALRAARTEHPSWPHPAFMLARHLRAAGDSAGAAELDAQWRALDTERAVLARYADIVRSAGKAGAAVEVVDLEQVLAAYRASATRDGGDLYIDFVHLDAVGHVVVATELARRIAARLTGSGG